MAFEQIEPYADSDTDPADLMSHVDFQRRGLANVSLTNFTNSSLPSIASGSVVEVNGTLYQAVGDIAPGGSPANGVVYIKLNPTGISPNQTLTADLTATPPTWFDSEQGWYNSGGTARYVDFKMDKSGASYTDKRQFPFKNNEDVTFAADGLINKDIGIKTDNAFIKTKVISIGDWDMDATVFVNIAHGVTVGNIRTVEALIIDDGGTVLTPMTLNDFINPPDGTIQIVSGNVVLTRRTSGFFDDTDYNATSYNRGWVTVEYIA